MEKPYRLMTPGPVQVPESVLKELGRPMIHHRTPEFEKILTRVLGRLKEVFQTKQPVFIQAATGSGGLESAIVNTLSPGDKVVAIVSGKFGERWRDIAKNYGMNVISLEVEWGKALDPRMLDATLELHMDVRAVLTQACETSTAVVHPMKEIGRIVRAKSNAILMVDGITALGVMDLPMDAWNLDVVVGGSQKSFMLPAGLQFIALSEKAWDFQTRAKCPRYYWDLKEELKANKANQTRFSTPVPYVRALDAGLEVMLKDGLQSNITRFARLAKQLRAGGEKLGLKVYAEAPSPSVTAFVTPVDGEKLRDHLEAKYNITVMGGQDKLKGKIIRIGTLGYISEEDLEATLESLANALTDLGHSADGKSAVAAFRMVVRK
ncbi:MAG: alanine--glyoxylate aminotransferase family protein [Bdellovibrionia bacterium]